MIHLVSAFRNAEHRLDPYFAMVRALRTIAPCRVLAVVGDSQDHTRDRIENWAKDDRGGKTWWFEHNHGQPEWGSTERPERLVALSGLLNTALDELQRYIAADDTVVWMEGDLFWDPFTLLQLERFLRRPEVDVVAPMVFAGEAFYDTWAFRTLPTEANNVPERWGPFWPHGNYADATNPAPLVEMSSVGSCVAMTGLVAKLVRVQDGNALVGWCGQARELGFRVWCAKDLRVQHPCDLREASTR
jgi:hypothetical protein